MVNKPEKSNQVEYLKEAVTRTFEDIEAGKLLLISSETPMTEEEVEMIMSTMADQYNIPIGVMTVLVAKLLHEGGTKRNFSRKLSAKAVEASSEIEYSISLDDLRYILTESNHHNKAKNLAQSESMFLYCYEAGVKLNKPGDLYQKIVTETGQTFEIEESAWLSGFQENATHCPNHLKTLIRDTLGSQAKEKYKPAIKMTKKKKS